jgi:hypothetical protein
MNANIIFLIFFSIAVLKPINIPNINRYMGMGLFVLISLWFLITVIKNYRHLFKTYTWQIAAVILFITINVIALITNLHRFENLTLLIFYGLASFAVWLIFPMTWVIFKYNNVQKYSWIGWAVIVFIVSVALWQIIDMSASWQIRQYFVAADARNLITSVTRWHTIYGAIAAIIALVCLKQIFTPTVHKAAKVFFLLLALLSLYTGALGESRNFFFTLGVGLLAMSFTTILKAPKTTIIIIILTIVGTHWLIINNNRIARDYGNVLPYISKLNQGKPITKQDFIPKLNNHSMSNRLNFWKRGIKLWQQNPWLGIGAGSFRASSNQKYFNLHNYYMQVLVDSGIIGIASLIILITLLTIKAYSAGNLAIFIAILSSLIFDNYLDYSMGWVLCMVWLLKQSEQPIQLPK